MSDKRFRLSDMEFDEVSLVMAGDDPTAKVVIAKAAPKSAEYENAGPTLGAATEDLNWEDTMPEIQKDDLPEEVVTYIGELEKSLADAIELLTGEDDDEDIIEDADDTEESDPLAKADPIIKQMFDELHQRVEQAEAIAKSERDARRLATGIEKAKAFAAIGDPKDIAEMIMGLEDTDPDTAEKVEKMLSTASQQLHNSALFQEIGKSVSEFSVGSSIEAFAQELQKSDPSLTPEQAMARAYEANPQAYNDYLSGKAV